MHVLAPSGPGAQPLATHRVPTMQVTEAQGWVPPAAGQATSSLPLEQMGTLTGSAAHGVRPMSGPRGGLLVSERWRRCVWGPQPCTSARLQAGAVMHGLLQAAHLWGCRPRCSRHSSCPCRSGQQGRRWAGCRAPPGTPLVGPLVGRGRAPPLLAASMGRARTRLCSCRKTRGTCYLQTQGGVDSSGRRGPGGGRAPSAWLIYAPTSVASSMTTSSTPHAGSFRAILTRCAPHDLAQVAGTVGGCAACVGGRHAGACCMGCHQPKDENQPSHT